MAEATYGTKFEYIKQFEVFNSKKKMTPVVEI